ncbi:hypothetical protein ES707_02980 [subsurface metagenome]
MTTTKAVEQGKVKKKEVVIGTGGLILIGIIAYFVLRPKPAKEALTIKIEVYDAERGWHTPDILTAGKSYPVWVLTTNTTTKAKDFSLTLTGFLEGASFFQIGPASVHLAAKDSLAAIKGVAFGVPAGTAGKTGSILAEALDPAGKIIAKAEEPITIQY